MEIDLIEKKIYRDIWIARKNMTILNSFLFEIIRKNKSVKYDVVHKALMMSAIDTCMLALSRLLNQNPQSSECTLRKYREKVIAELEITKDNGKKISKQCRKDRDYLKDVKYIELTNELENKYWDRIKPVRDKILSHTDFDADMYDINGVAFNMLDIVDFVEDQHRVLKSAHMDASMPGHYIENNIDEIMSYWLKKLE